MRIRLLINASLFLALAAVIAWAIVQENSLPPRVLIPAIVGPLALSLYAIALALTAGINIAAAIEYRTALVVVALASAVFMLTLLSLVSAIDTYIHRYAPLTAILLFALAVSNLNWMRFADLPRRESEARAVLDTLNSQLTESGQHEQPD